MVPKPKAMSMVGLVQVILAAGFVVWLLLWPSTGDRFAWPVVPRMTAMFIGVSFIARTYLGLHLWREKYWYRLRWQVWGNYGFLAVIALATFWHVEAMNWKADIVVAHIWVIAYIVEPLILPLVEPRGEQRNRPLPAELREGPIFMGLKWVCAAALVVGAAMAGLLLINPAFMNTRWPWPLDPFDARIMAAFPTLAALWAAHVYFAEDWAEAKLGVLGLALFAAGHFVVWLINLPSFDFSRHNVWSYGIVFGLFAALFAFYYWRQQRVSVPARSPLSQTAGG
jgi:hypothetical protein